MTGMAIATSGSVAANPNKGIPGCGGNGIDKTRVHETVSASSSAAGNPYRPRIDFTADVRVQVEFTDEPYDEEFYENDTKIYVKGNINGQGTGEEGGEYKVKSKIDDLGFIPLGWNSIQVWIDLEFSPIRGTSDEYARTEGAVLGLSPAEDPKQATIANALAF